MCLVYSVLPVSLDCPCLITPSVFSDVYVYSQLKLDVDIITCCILWLLFCITSNESNTNICVQTAVVKQMKRNNEINPLFCNNIARTDWGDKSGNFRIRKSKKDTQYNVQIRKDQKTIIYKTLHIKLKIEQCESHKKCRKHNEMTKRKKDKQSENIAE